MSGVDDPDRLLRRLQGRRSLARLVLSFERLWPALWPAVGVAGLFVCVALLDIPRSLPGWAQATLLAVTLVGMAIALWRGLHGLVLPDAGAANRRLETASGLTHRPLSVLADRPVQSDPTAQALWQAHLDRALAQVHRMRVGLPRPGLARRDRRALRLGLVVGLLACLTIAGTEAPSRLLHALQPRLASGAAAPDTQVQAWITPPAYTGIAPVFLQSEVGAVSVPAGSHLTVSVTGDTATPSLTLGGKSVTFTPLDAASYQAEVTLQTGGRLDVSRGGGMLAGWSVTVIPDQPPMAAWSEPPGRAVRGLQLRLPWQVADDYGVVELKAELRLQDRPEAAPIIVTIPMPGGRPKSAKSVTMQDLTANPWAGLAVVGHLIASDAIGQTGLSDAASFILPERSFQNPLARALIEVRKSLSLDPDDRSEAIAALDDLLGQPDAFAADIGAYVNLAAIEYLLIRNHEPDVVEQAQARLWSLALHLEEGATERTARALDAARNAVKDAIAKSQQEPNEANRTDLDRKIDALEEAIRRHMEALADQARREMAETPYDPDMQHLDASRMDRLAEEARQAAREGRMEDAQQKMAQLEQMLDQLRNARPMQQAQRNQQRSAERKRGRQQMGALQDMIAREGALLDHIQQRSPPGSDQGGDQRQPQSGQFQGAQNQNDAQAQNQGQSQGQRGKGRNPPSADQGGDATAQRDSERRVQEALRRSLGELMQQFGDLSGEVPSSLGDAERAMRDAAQALAQGQDAAAGKAEQQALAAMKQGGQQMAQQMARQFGRGQPSDGDDGDGDSPGGIAGFTLQDGPGDQDGDGRGSRSGERGRGNQGRDPLGRQTGQGLSGLDDSSDVKVPEEMERQRTRAIQDELRRRGADRTRPQPELDYIDRLLKQF